MVPSEYHNEKEYEFDELFRHCEKDHQMNLVEGKKPHFDKAQTQNHSALLMPQPCSCQTYT